PNSSTTSNGRTADSRRVRLLDACGQSKRSTAVIPAKNLETNKGAIPVASGALPDATAFRMAQRVKLQKWLRKKLKPSPSRSPRIRNFVLPRMFVHGQVLALHGHPGPIPWPSPRNAVSAVGPCAPTGTEASVTPSSMKKARKAAEALPH